MSAVEGAVRAELRRLEIEPSESFLAAALIDLARRLDDGPADRAAAMLSAEMRRLLAELKQTEVNSGELERFLTGISNPSFRGPGE